MPPPPNILIVEDEAILAENIKDLLGDIVPNVRVVADGEHAVEMLKSFSPDAVVMDYWLPGMNGVETYARMARQSASRIDCVIITGECEETLREAAADHGIRSILTKPFAFAELLERLEPATDAAAGEPGRADDDTALPGLA